MDLIKCEPGDFQLDGIEVTFVRENGQPQRMALTDASGNTFIVGNQYGYALQLFRKAPPVLVKRWKLSGTLAGFPVSGDFDDESKANDALHEARAKGVDNVVLREYEIEETKATISTPDFPL